jgi:hypothetical protein
MASPESPRQPSPTLPQELIAAAPVLPADWPQRRTVMRELWVDRGEALVARCRLAAGWRGMGEAIFLRKIVRFFGEKTKGR